MEKQTADVTATGCLVNLAFISGFVAGLVWVPAEYGFWGVLFFSVVGGLLGMIGTALVLGLIVVPLAILITEGPGGLRRFVRGEWEP
jgi:hypothetical protein